MKQFLILLVSVILFSCSEGNKRDPIDVSCSEVNKRDPIDEITSPNDTLTYLKKNKFQQKDFVTDLDFDKIYNNEISVDFVVLGIFGNELYEHYESCRLKNLSLYSYDTIWNIHHLSEIPDDQLPARVAFLNDDNFHLVDLEIWNSNLQDYEIGPYKPYITGYDYYLGNGFAFSIMNEFLDFNSDGYLDLKVKYTRLDYEKASNLIRGKSISIFSDYQKKIANGEISKNKDFNVYEDEVWDSNNNFGLSGYGYITKYSDDGLLYFFHKD